MKRLSLALAILGCPACVIGGDREAPPVQLAAGTPKPFAAAVDTADGETFAVMKHDVCIAVDTAGGYILPISLDGPGFLSTIDADGAPVEPGPIDGLDCPTGSPWQGWARIQWETVDGHARARLEHSLTRHSGSSTIGGGGGDVPPDAGFAAQDLPASGPVPSGGELAFTGEAFPGFAIEVAQDTSTGPLKLSFSATFAATPTGDVPAAPASNVALVPSTVPDALASAATGGVPHWDGTHLGTDSRGDGTLFVDLATLCEDFTDKALFVGTPDGALLDLATTIPCQ